MAKMRFSLLLRPDEYIALRQLAKEDDRSQGGTIRHLIRREASERGLLPDPQSRPTGERQRETT